MYINVSEGESNIYQTIEDTVFIAGLFGHIWNLDISVRDNSARDDTGGMDFHGTCWEHQ